MMNKLLLAVAAALACSTALAVEPVLEEPDMSAMAEDLCSRDGNAGCYVAPSPPPKKPRQ